MFEQLLMILLSTTLWVFVIGPIILCAIFDNGGTNGISYKALVQGTLLLTVFVAVVLITIVAFLLVLDWLDGDATPISSMYHLFADKWSNR